MMRSWEPIYKGTTTVGVRCVDGIVLSTDRRVTSGFYVANKRGKKLLQVDDRVYATIAGVVADAQMLVDRVKAQVRYIKTITKQPLSVRAIANLTSNILFHSRFFPLIVHVIVAGIDDEGPAMFNIDLFGTLTEEKYIATGSGSPLAIAVLETKYREGLTVKEAIPIVVEAIKAAMRWDPGSGEGFDVVIITKEGVEELSQEKIEKT
ncbi:MAG: proteasome subunit beta [Candidatus Nezhaarchaeota archaeon]|nr:proteasome subunit beta [Candidatus Nezhaarchaeota archaeon]MCX8141643.1 proteasome subunit beta [Candidatus Nezhaarchaeota archaeon]MDW8049910.1 proteasome subunit beta [Nitrososphaerota archaeon]